MYAVGEEDEWISVTLLDALNARAHKRRRQLTAFLCGALTLLLRRTGCHRPSALKKPGDPGQGGRRSAMGGMDGTWKGRYIRFYTRLISPRSVKYVLLAFCVPFVRPVLYGIGPGLVWTTKSYAISNRIRSRLFKTQIDL
jgi:hypothetical protein